MAEIWELSKSFHKTADLLEKLNRSSLFNDEISNITRYDSGNSMRIEERNESLRRKINVVEHQTNIVSARFDELKKHLARHKQKQKLGLCSKEHQKVQISGVIPGKRKGTLSGTVKVPLAEMNSVDNSSLNIAYSQITSDTPNILLNQFHVSSLYSQAFPESVANDKAALFTNSGISELKFKGVKKSVGTQTDSFIFCDHCQMISPLKMKYNNECFQAGANFSHGNFMANIETYCLPKPNEAFSSHKPSGENLILEKNVLQRDVQAYETLSKELCDINQSSISHDVNASVNENNNLTSDKAFTQDTIIKGFSLEHENSSQTNVVELPLDIEHISPSRKTASVCMELNKVEILNVAAPPDANVNSNSSGHIIEEDVTQFSKVSKDVACSSVPSNVQNSLEKDTFSRTQTSEAPISLLSEKSTNVSENVNVRGVDNHTDIKEVFPESHGSTKVLEETTDLVGNQQVSCKESSVNMLRTQNIQDSLESVYTNERNEILISNSDVCDKALTLKESGLSLKGSKTNNGELFESKNNEGIANLIEDIQKKSECNQDLHKSPIKRTKINQERETTIPDVTTSLSETDDEDDNASSFSFTATAAFQRLVGNIPTTRKVQMKTISDSDSNSDDEIEKALSTALNPSIAGISRDQEKLEGASVENQLSAVVPDTKNICTSPSASPKRKSSMKPTSKIKGKLSKATISALGLSSDSDDPESSLKKGSEEEDEDEFNFYD